MSHTSITNIYAKRNKSTHVNENEEEYFSSNHGQMSSSKSSISVSMSSTRPITNIRKNLTRRTWMTTTKALQLGQLRYQLSSGCCMKTKHSTKRKKGSNNLKEKQMQQNNKRVINICKT